MGRLIIRGATLLPCDGRQILRRTDILIDNGLIAAIGGVDTTGAQILEVKGVLTPALVNAHVHVDQALLSKGFVPCAAPRMRARVELPAYCGALLQDDLEQAGRMTLARSQKSATFVLGDPSGTFLRTPALAKLGSVRVVSAVDALGHDPEAALEGLKSAGPRLSGALFAGDAERTPLPRLERAAALAKRAGVPLMVHLGTMPDDRQGLRRLERAGALWEGLVLAHGTGRSLSDPKSIRTLADSGAHVVLTPAHELVSGAPLPEIDRLITGGVHVGLGSESGATRLGLDLSEEARLLYRILKARSEQAASLALEAATRGGGRALGQKTGSLEVGMRADILLFDLDVAPDDDHESVARRVLFHCPSRVNRAWLDGELVLERGQPRFPVDVDERAVEDAQRRGLRGVLEARVKPGVRWVHFLDWLDGPVRKNEGWHSGRLPLGAFDPRAE